MSKKTQPPEFISKALQLDGSAEAIKDYYAQWAETYDADLVGDHISPYHMVKTLVSWLGQNRPQQKLDELSVMDIGCGTGLVARALIEQGFKFIDGVDLSPEMIVKAQQLGIYRELSANVDINRDVHHQWYQQYAVVTCCGVFTLGHVQPESLRTMLRFVEPGGWLIATTRQAYYEQTNYQRVSDQLLEEGVATLQVHIENAPYTHDSGAHYWLYQVT